MWFSGVSPRVPARGRRLYCKISEFLEMQTHTLTFSHSFHSFFFLFHWVGFSACTLARRLILSGIRCEEINQFSLYLSVLFFFHIPLLNMFFLSLVRPFASPFHITLLSTLPPSRSSSFPLISSLSALLPLAKVLERGNEKCMYCVAVECCFLCFVHGS